MSSSEAVSFQSAVLEKTVAFESSESLKAFRVAAMEARFHTTLSGFAATEAKEAAQKARAAAMDARYACMYSVQHFLQ